MASSSGNVPRQQSAPFGGHPQSTVLTRLPDSGVRDGILTFAKLVSYLSSRGFRTDEVGGSEGAAALGREKAQGFAGWAFPRCRWSCPPCSPATAALNGCA